MSAIRQVETAGGAVLETEVSGLTEGPWIVLSNSLGATRDMWRPQLAMLERCFRVLRYDTRGHGGSSAPPCPYAFSDLVADAVAVMDAHAVAQADFMGLSLGGMTALGLGLAHPQRVSAVICCAARADAPPPFVQSWTDRLAVIDREGVAGIWAGTLERWLTAETRSADPTLVRELEAAFRRTSADGYRGCAEALKRLDYLKDLPNLSVPALFVSGARDLAAAPAAMKEMAEAAPQGRYVEIPDAAHILNCDNPPAFNHAIADFLKISPRLSEAG